MQGIYRENIILLTKQLSEKVRISSLNPTILVLKIYDVKWQTPEYLYCLNICIAWILLLPEYFYSLNTLIP